jgi:Fis family transcriptional regulator
VDEHQENNSTSIRPIPNRQFQDEGGSPLKSFGGNAADPDFSTWLDKASLEALVEIKISRFFDQLDSHYPEDLYSMIISKIEKTLLHQILRRTGYNQAQAAKILGINRNTLRKKMTEYNLG